MVFEAEMCVFVAAVESDCVSENVGDVNADENADEPVDENAVEIAVIEGVKNVR